MEDDSQKAFVIAGKDVAIAPGLIRSASSFLRAHIDALLPFRYHFSNPPPFLFCQQDEIGWDGME